MTRWRRRRRRRRRRQSDDSKAVLEQLTTEQLETLLQDLQLEVLTETDGLFNGSVAYNQSSGDGWQSQQQHQHVTAEVHTHKHVYVVQGVPF